MRFVKINFEKDTTDSELMKEIQKRIVNINQYVQHPDRDSLAPLLGQDLQERYGNERVLNMADSALWGGNDVIEDASEKFTKLFERFNDKYFDGKLPHYEVIVRLSISYYGRTIWRAGHALELLAGSEAHMVARLLDDMAHIATTDEYGERWRDELIRLGRAGAPVDVYPGMEKLSAEEFIAESARVHAEVSCKQEIN